MIASIMSDDKPKDTPPETAAARGGRAAWLRALPLAVIVVLMLVAWFVLDLPQYLSLEAIAQNQRQLTEAARHPFAAPVFILAYLVVVALSIPGATFLTLLGGFLFGIVTGTVLVVTGATLGAVVIFVVARTAIAQPLAKRAGPKLEELRHGFEKNAFFYLLFLRLVPLFPFWLVNIVPAALGMKLAPYALATLLGIIPGSAVYVSVGNGLSAVIQSGENPNLGIIFQPEVLLPILALAVLSLVPIVVKKQRDKKQNPPPPSANSEQSP
ncbi:MAG: TVP38/TMEM64 family protein [Alphaproteobacteria bacterium]|nr:TVP38/TMEM64 family protein [Alphaproteobacteria bacterium]